MGSRQSSLIIKDEQQMMNKESHAIIRRVQVAAYYLLPTAY